MRARLRLHAPALVLSLLAGTAVLVAVLADQLSWPTATAFPALHDSRYAYVAGGAGERVAPFARVVAWCAAALVVPLLAAAVVAAVVRGRSPRGRR